MNRKVGLLTSGVEAFTLVFDGTFSLVDFDYAEQGQVELVASLARLTNAFFRGEATITLGPKKFFTQSLVLEIADGDTRYSCSGSGQRLGMSKRKERRLSALPICRCTRTR